VSPSAVPTRTEETNGGLDGIIRAAVAPCNGFRAVLALIAPVGVVARAAADSSREGHIARRGAKGWAASLGHGLLPPAPRTVFQ